MKSPHASLLLVSGWTAAAAGASENAVHSVLMEDVAAGTDEEGGGVAVETLVVGAEAKAPQMSLLAAGTVVVATAGEGAKEANEEDVCWICCCGCCGCAGSGVLISQLCWVREDTSVLSVDGSAMPGIICGSSTGTGLVFGAGFVFGVSLVVFSGSVVVLSSRASRIRE